MPKTIVVSDLHGNTDVLQDVLEHSGFSAGDSLIVAGDLVDVGTQDTIGLADSLGATVLAGNHEVSAAIGLRITPQNPETRAIAPELARRFASGEWPLAVAVEGWLITHAGVSESLSDVIAEADSDPATIAEKLNARFRDEIASAVRQMPLDYDELASYRLIGGELGPLWFRPMDLTRIPSGLRQIVGHTPPEALSPAQLAALELRGWLLVEPGGHAATGRGPGLRYALIQNGEAEVVEA